MAIPKGALLRAEHSLQASIAQSDAVVSLEDPDGQKARAELLELLEAADKRLALRLAAITPKKNGQLRFSAAQAIAYRAQINLVTQAVKNGVQGVALEVGNKAVNKSVKQGVTLLSKLEKDFKGVSVSPSIVAAMQQSHILRGPKAALVTRVATSLDRYGLQMGMQFSKIIQVGLVSGASNDEMVAALIGHAGPKGKVSLAAREIAPGIVQRIREGDIPEGLFVRHRYWPERIVRTEVAYAYSGARLDALRQMRADGLNVRKKIVATFDTRTAPDSIAVHGQIRELEDVFTDGLGRQYVHPPGRPNDRETIIPWFDDWEEVPSSEPPTPNEQQQAIDLATNAPTPPVEAPPEPPKDAADLARVEAEVAAAKRRAQAEHDAERFKIEAEEERQTRAAALLLEHERDKIKGAQAIVKKLEEEAAAAAAAKTQKKLSKIDVAITKKLKGPTPHLGTLELYKLAGEDPESFAQIVNAMRAEPLPVETITKGIVQHHEVLDALVRDTVSGYGKTVKGLGAEKAAGALDAWKKDPAFVGWLDELVGKKDLKSKKLLAALVHSEQKPFVVGKPSPALTWNASLKLGKQGTAAAKLLKGALAPQVPVGKAWLFGDGGGGFVDLYDPDTKLKLGYFKKIGTAYEVHPPDLLGVHWTKKSFATQQAAADYAAEVSAEITKQKLAKGLPLPKPAYYTPPIVPSTPPPPASAAGQKKKPLNTSDTSRFNLKAEGPTTVIGPFKPDDPAAAKEIAAARKLAREHFRKAGVATRRSGTTEQNGVDQVLERAGLTREQHKWSSRFGGEDCWYTSSVGPKAFVGRFLTGRTTLKDAEEIADDLRVSRAEAQKWIQYARAKYAATQEALEHRIAKGELAKWVDKDGYVTLYRGVKGSQAAKLRTAREQGTTTKVDLRSVSSWSVKRSSAASFSDGNNVIVQARVHYTRIFSQYEQEEIAMRRYGDGEAEWIVIADQEQYLMNSEDITNNRNE